MAEQNNNNQHPEDMGQIPFWDFMRSIDPSRQGPGFGVDHFDGPEFQAGFPFGPRDFHSWGGRGGWGGHWGGPWGGPWGRGGHNFHGRHGRPHGRHGRRRDGNDDREDQPEEMEHSEMEESPDTMRDTPDGPDGAAAAEGVNLPHRPGAFPPPPPPGPRPFGPGPHRRRGGCRGGRGRDRGHHGPPPPPPTWNGPFDFRPLMHTFSSHPFAQAMRDYVEQTRSAPAADGQNNEEQDEIFVPPVDIFNTEKTYVLHISLPGAVKEDIGVNWDADKSVLNVAGVVYRPGNEEFLQSLTSSERKVGMFERAIKLPPAGAEDNGEIDGFGITAKMENGILIVTVPKTDKEWTEIHKVDVE